MLSRRRCLCAESREPPVKAGTRLTAIGWGWTKQGVPPEVLQQVGLSASQPASQPITTWKSPGPTAIWIQLFKDAGCLPPSSCCFIRRLPFRFTVWRGARSWSLI